MSEYFGVYRGGEFESGVYFYIRRLNRPRLMHACARSKIVAQARSNEKTALLFVTLLSNISHLHIIL